MILEQIILIGSIALIILGPASILGYLMYVIWQKLGRNPASATQMSLGMAGLMILVLVLSVITILVIFQLFNKRF